MNDKVEDNTQPEKNLVSNPPIAAEQSQNEAISLFTPENYPEEKPVTWPKPSITGKYQPPQYEPALQSQVSIQFKALEQHIDDCIKVVNAQMQTLKAEIDGKIDMLRKEIDEVKTKRKDKNTKWWDMRLVIMSVLGAAVLALLVDNYWSQFWKWLTRP